MFKKHGGWVCDEILSSRMGSQDRNAGAAGSLDSRPAQAYQPATMRHW